MCAWGTVICKRGTVMCAWGTVMCAWGTVMCAWGTVIEQKVPVWGKNLEKCDKMACSEPADFLVKNGEDAITAPLDDIWVEFMGMNLCVNTILKRKI